MCSKVWHILLSCNQAGIDQVSSFIATRNQFLCQVEGKIRATLLGLTVSLPSMLKWRIEEYRR